MFKEKYDCRAAAKNKKSSDGGKKTSRERNINSSGDAKRSYNGYSTDVETIKSTRVTFKKGMKKTRGDLTEDEGQSRNQDRHQFRNRKKDDAGINLHCLI